MFGYIMKVMITVTIIGGKCMIEKLLDIFKLHFGDDQGKRIYDEACSNY